MSRYFPHTAYAEDQPLAGTILTVHVLTRGYTTGTVVGLGIAAASGVASRIRGTTPVPAAAAPFPTSATTTSTATAALRSSGLHTFLRKSGTASAISIGFTGVTMLARMYGREDIEWRDRAWRLMESRSQLEVDDWTYSGAAAGVAALGIARAADCNICHRIWTFLETSPSNGDRDPVTLGPFDYVNLGSFEEALSSKCSRHLPLVKSFHNFCNQRRPLFGRNPADIDIKFQRPGVLTFEESTSTGVQYANFLLLKRESIPNHPGIARILDPEWIDTSVVASWKKQCASSHGPKCANPVKIWLIRPAWVVDTEQRCLVPGARCESYVTLSYRWGKAPGLRILPDTISKLQTPVAIDDLTIASQLAPMVCHAVHLTSAIGERYLWVATLCIDHAREAESTQQLQLMAAIFANASLTIVALDGDAEDGFPGLQGISTPKNQDDDNYGFVPFGDEHFIRDKHDYFGLASWGAYHKRAWTYQEFNMSPRRLIISHNSLHWMYEIMRGMPNLGSFSNLIQDYNPRDLTYEEDALPSISGFLNVITQKRRIRPSWFENRQSYKDFTRPLPPGWTRQDIAEVADPELSEGGDQNVLLYPDGCHMYSFRHSSQPKHEHEHPWHWPFPVPDIQESTQPFMPEQTLYISCDTRRAAVSAFQTGEKNDVSLYSDKKKIGVLRLHNKDQLEDFSQLDAGWASAKEVELVAICRVRNYERSYDKTTGLFSRPFPTTEVYNVLWAEWIDGVAYRLASGRVDKAA
ncbi:heterokaryon incompatibility protein-domain-containing protein [Colletotrichum phormii]|uniref:Heterokaryon incompatibility protein-domain-containing protein n=1 Tax=Colletotrichum phormii TaxID=359342 RepID=A0AAJ0A2G9_9PEZI|nr:heterokaryon incompatibility protein-domain-containing protein [Colletotrichum phormii]KAK1655258.1 heterokaryon incompatibility protein-domain-containing protein [Colletotrichum phormii]